MTVKTLSLGDLQTNCYILTDDETSSAVIIDPGAESEKIIQNISSMSLKVEYIILTHSHFDHTGALDDIKEYTNAKIVIHKSEEKCISDENLSLSGVFGYSTPKSTADITVSDNDTLPFGNDKLKFIHTPGHTVGSMCILIKDIMFSGDTLFYLSMGRTDFPGGSNAQMRDSLKALSGLSPDIRVYPGHGDSTTIGFEASNNPFMR